MMNLKIPILLAWDNINAETLLRDHFHLGKKARHTLRMSHDVQLNNEQLTDWRRPLHAGDLLVLPLLEKAVITSADRPIDIVYEDDFILVANKPANLKTHPNDSSEIDSCQQRVQAYLNATGQSGASAFPVHRLDEATSGLLLFAKNTIALAAFSYQLEQRTIHRHYLAITDNIWKGPANFTIRKPIGSDRHHPNKRRVSPGGQTAVTHVAILARHQAQNNTLLECRLDTGRTHQIRVHLSDAGFPIIGDSLYGGSNRAARLLLHAKQLQTYHPFLDKTLKWEQSPDDSFRLKKA